MPVIKIKRGTRAQLDTAAAASGLLAGEVYLITDESRLAVGLSTSTYKTMAQRAETPVPALVNTMLSSSVYPVAANISQVALANATPVVGRQYIWPFSVNKKLTINSLGIRVGTSGASSTAFLGVYRNQPVSGVDWPDSAPIASHATGLTTSSTGFKSASNSQGAVDLLPDTVYWASLLVPSGTAPVLSGLTQNSVQAGFGSGSDGNMTTNLRFSNATGALTTPPTTRGSYTTNAGQVPAIFLIP